MGTTTRRVAKVHPGHAVVCWAQEYEDLCEGQPYDVTYPTWSSWFLEHVVSTLPDPVK